MKNDYCAMENRQRHLSGDNKSKAKAKPIPNGPDSKALTPGTTQVQTNRAAAVVKSAGSAAVAEAVQHASERQRPVGDDGPQ